MKPTGRFVVIYADAVDHNPNLTLIDAAVFREIILLANKNGRCTASIDSIASATKTSRSSCKRSILYLVKLGYISKIGTHRHPSEITVKKGFTVKKNCKFDPSICAPQPGVMKKELEDLWGKKWTGVICNNFFGDIWSLHKNSKVAYKLYLKTKSWKDFSDKIKTKKFKCEDCGAIGGNEVHHRSYENLGKETESDVMVLCRSCHQKHHDKEK